MPNMRDFATKDYPILLAADTIDASKGALYGTEANLEPRTAGRTILIGLGGTGIRTIDHVKGVISKTLKPTWPKYISFLGIDADWLEFGQAKYLTESEIQVITQPGANDRWHKPGHRALAHKRFMVDGVHLGDLEGPGSGRRRLIGKFKIHDQQPGSLGVDKLIAGRITDLVTDKMEHLSPNANDCYEVYVIGSVCGGTCSGAFLEMPAIIKSAMGNNRRFHVNALLYLPDTLSGLDPVYAHELYANGYASLKELDYYQGMAMRSGSPETFSFNNAANPEVSISDGFFRIPYLVGSTQPESNEASTTAMETIAEFLVSILGEIQSDKGQFSVESFMDNALKHQGDRLYSDPATKGAEHPEHNHDRPRAYAAVGFAEASAPERIVRAYTVAKVCGKLGLAPVSKEARAELKAHGETLLPFCGEKDYMSAVEGTAAAKTIMAPLMGVLDIVHNGAFAYAADLSQNPPEWEDILEGRCDNAAILQMTENVIKNKTSLDTMKKLADKLKELFAQYRKAVQDFVQTDGPLAFFNLYKGNFTPVGDDHGMGIEAMLRNLCDGKTAEGKAYRGWTTPEATEKELKAAKQTILDTRRGILRSILKKDLYTAQAGQWTVAYEAWVKSRIDDERRRFALGNHGKLRELILEPAAMLADELRAFGHILAALTGAYRGLGDKMNSFQQFTTARDGRTEVNIAAIDDSAYNWLKAQADATVTNLSATKIRALLVDNFFADPAAWLNVPDNLVTSTAGDSIRLLISDVAVPARVVFDQFMATQLPPMLNVSIETMFAELQARMPYEKTAEKIVEKLAATSIPQFNGNISPDHIYVVYPASLNGNDQGKQIIEALKTAIGNAFPGKSPQVFASDDTGTIRMYQLAAPFEVYRLSALKSWEEYYEAALRDPGSGLHSLSPDLTRTVSAETGASYTERIGWSKYPAITCQSADPRQKDPVTGEVSHEGQRRLEMDKIIDEARELGVLYSENTPYGWVIRRVNCDKSIAWDRFDLFACQPDAETGMLPMGKQLAEAVAIQHGRTLGNISKDVSLTYGGILETPRTTEELAWQAAHRVLYAHMPMYIEVRDTLENHFRAWGNQILSFNATLIQRLRPAKMVHMMKARRLYAKADGTWVIRIKGGTERNLAALTDAMKQFLLPKDKRMVEGGLLAYFLFRKLEAALPGKEFDDFYRFSMDCYQELIATMDTDTLKLGKETADFVQQEAEALVAKGARLGENTEVSEKFMTAMADMGLTEAELKELQVFYHRTGMEL